jgi:hypothetical protein
VHNTNQLAKKIIFGSFALTIASTDGSITNMQVIEANVRGPGMCVCLSHQKHTHVCVCVCVRECENMRLRDAHVFTQYCPHNTDRSHIGEQETSLVGATLQSAAGFKGKLEFAYEEVSLSRAQA